MIQLGIHKEEFVLLFEARTFQEICEYYDKNTPTPENIKYLRLKYI